MDKIKAGSQMNMPDERFAVQSTSRQGIGPPPPLGKDWTSLSSLPNLATGAANTPTIFKRDDFQEVYGQPASSRITLGSNEEIIKNNLSVLSTSPPMSANLPSVPPDDPLLHLLDLPSAAPESSSIESSSSVLNPRAARSEQEVNHRGDDTAARLGGKQNQDLAVDLCETRATSEPGKHHSVATQLDKLPARNAQDIIDDDSKPDLKEPADGWLSTGNEPLDDVHIPLSMDPSTKFPSTVFPQPGSAATPVAADSLTLAPIEDSHRFMRMTALAAKSLIGHKYLDTAKGKSPTSPFHN